MEHFRFFKEIKKFVNSAVRSAQVPKEFKKYEKELKRSQLRHYERTVFWVKKLKPNASEALLIAAYAHDVERWFRDPRKSRKIYDKRHAKRSAEIVSNFLKKLGANKALINKVYFLILHHEIGGSYEANVLKDADSISFFENNIKIHAKLFPKSLKKKIKWMYNRITS